ncbi:MAG TPA: Fic family protein [Polyangiales bacterium]|nr:Fic family protein [Polyangiales bacterium]
MRRPVGYAALIERFALQVPAPRHLSSIGPGARERHVTADGVHESFPGQFARDDTIDHLTFALRYDGVDLLTLRSVFEALGPDALTVAIRERPTSAYLRRLWFFYEWLLDARLAVDDVAAGAYVDVLDGNEYVTRPGRKLRRYRVNFNMLSPSPEWCPLVRRTETIEGYAKAGLSGLAHAVVSELSPGDLQRAIRYLYAKETRASFEIERATPSDRMERFVEALFSQAQGSGPSWWDLDELIRIAGIIISDPRFTPKSLRSTEVRVSEQRLLSGHERVHYIAPRHKDLADLMAAFVAAWRAHHDAPSSEPFVDFVVAGCLSFGFVYLHPFEDGNGRLHRLILHRVLSATNFTPKAVVIPTSAAILHDQPGYDTALEDFSKRIMPFVEYAIDPRDGGMQVSNETRHLYRYPDLTVQLEALCRWFEAAIKTELVEELEVLRAMDAAKTAMRDSVELPDQREDLFLRLVVQNQRDGRGFVLSKAKRELFAELTDDELHRLEASIQQAFRDVKGLS